MLNAEEAYVPPFPPRSVEWLSTFAIIKNARKNLLSIWAEPDFEKEVLMTKVLGRTVFVANNPKMVQQVFVKFNPSFECKSKLMRRAIKPVIGNGLFISDGAIWQSRRKIVGKAIHGSRVPGLIPAIVEVVSDLRTSWLKQLEQSPNNVAQINMLSEMTKLTAEIIARSIFGCDLGKENAQKIADGFSHYQSNIGAFNLLALFGLPHFMTYLSSRGIRRPAKQVTSVIEDLIHSYFNENKAAFAVDVCLAKNDARKPFLEFLRIKKQNSDKLDWQAIRDEAAVIFMAGHETTANCLAWAFFLLSQAPKVAKKLYQEIDSVLGQRLPIHADIGKLVYTRAIIEETLRLYPPIPILSRQVKKAESIGRYNIPKGALLLVVPWLLHRHKLFWEKPDFFIPERFLPNSPAIDQYLYIPFSVGPRVCAGMNFGLTEAILCLATLSQALQFKLVPNTTIQAVSHLALRPDDGNGRLPLIMQKREKGNV